MLGIVVESLVVKPFEGRRVRERETEKLFA
jgi:hypothetical protein